MDLLATRELSANRLAVALRVPSNRVTGTVAGQCGITPDTALRLSRALWQQHPLLA